MNRWPVLAWEGRFHDGTAINRWPVLAWEGRFHKISRFTHLNYQTLWCKIVVSLVCYHRYLFNKNSYYLRQLVHIHLQRLQTGEANRSAMPICKS